jgi:hypothetical protein
MDSTRYDLFELPPNGFPQWISSAADLTEAKRQLEALPEPHVGGEYLIRDFYAGSVVAYRAPQLANGHGCQPWGTGANRQRLRTARWRQSS